jgi:5-methylcytosine-specific restriction endonuclease McrA
MTPQVGRTYYRKCRSGQAFVVRVEAVGEWVDYRVLHGPRRAVSLGAGRCKARNFLDWVETEARDSYDHLDGCRLHATLLVQNTRGEPILRCSEKRAAFYLRKGYAVRVSDGVLRFTDDQTEQRLRLLYNGEFSAFFLAVKNDRCVACGRGDNLTRHHVVPRRHLAKVPRRWRGCLSNVLFVCRGCHDQYEAVPEPAPVMGDDWQEYARRWQQHFVEALSPRCMPAGWDIISVTNLEAVAALPEPP